MARCAIEAQLFAARARSSPAIANRKARSKYLRAFASFPLSCAIHPAISVTDAAAANNRGTDTPWEGDINCGPICCVR
ncbi:hypothetical protein GCM10027360_31280 [Amycolatopsis echigonensis]|uniref:Uncharacterized protein n=1 Tax=Amycolatopsis tucumanensis TaxID=401106 RepID=A0ABP7IJT2_9PSEU